MHQIPMQQRSCNQPINLSLFDQNTLRSSESDHDIWIYGEYALARIDSHYATSYIQSPNRHKDNNSAAQNSKIWKAEQFYSVRNGLLERRTVSLRCVHEGNIVWRIQRSVSWPTTYCRTIVVIQISESMHIRHDFQCKISYKECNNIPMAKLDSIPERLLLGFITIILLISFLSLSFTGKNITYATRFTPPSTENTLRNQSYYTEGQVLIILMLIAYSFFLPAVGYVTIMRSKKWIAAMWIGFLICTGILLFLNIHFMLGSSSYRSYLESLSTQISSNPNYCSESLCQLTTCTRLKTFGQARSMSIAFIVIDCIFVSAMIFVTVLISKKRGKEGQLELII